MTILEQYRLYLQGGDFLDCGKPEACAPCFELVRLVVPAGAYTGNLRVHLDEERRKAIEGEEWKECADKREKVKSWGYPSDYCGPPITAVIVFVDNGRFDISQRSFKPRGMLWSEARALGLRPLTTDEQILVVGYLLEFIEGLNKSGASRGGGVLQDRNLIYIDYNNPNSVEEGDSQEVADRIDPRHCIVRCAQRIASADRCPVIASGYCGYLFVRE